MAEDRPGREGIEREDDCMYPVGSIWKVAVERVVDLDPFMTVRVFEVLVGMDDVDEVFDSVVDALRRDGWRCAITKRLCGESRALCTRDIVVKVPLKSGGDVKLKDVELTVGAVRVVSFFLME